MKIITGFDCKSDLVGSFTGNMHSQTIEENLLITWGAAYRKVEKGCYVFREGTQGVFYHQLVKGKVKWVNIDDEGKEFIQVLIKPGECFGELPMFDDGPYVSSAIAIEDSVVLRLRKEDFLLLLQEQPAIHFSFTRLITSRLRQKFIFLKELSYPDPERKVMTVLGYYRRNSDQELHGRRKIELTRQQIANMTGLRVETVIRTIRSLHTKGSLLIEGGKVYL